MVRTHKLKRRKQRLPKTKLSTIPKHLIFFDTETHIITDDNDITHFPLRLGVAIYINLDTQNKVKKRDVLVFYSADEFLQFVLSKCKSKQKLWIYAHNVGFDIRVLDLPNLINDYNFTSTPPIVNNRVFIWDIKTDKNTITFLDTANYGVYSVDQLGEDMGFPKQSVDFDTVTNDDLIEYCIRDTEILEKFILSYIGFIWLNDLGAVKITIASQAHTTFRYRFMDIPPHIHIDDKAIELERKAYTGGRTECFYIGKLNSANYYYVDFNSMYPHVMKNKPVPYKLLGVTSNVPVRLLKARANKYYVIADVLIKTDVNAYPVKRNNKLVFPIGTFRTVLHQPELKIAIENNDIIHVYHCCVYEQEYIFTKYVEFFYDLKTRYTTEDNKTWRYMTKLFLNSLYGKFGQIQPKREIDKSGQSNEVWRTCGYDSTKDRYYQNLMWYGIMYLEYKEGETLYSCPAIAGAITSYAREYLYRTMQLIGKNNVFYTDTDSYIINKTGYNNIQPMLHPSNLGMLSLENETTEVHIYGNKDYIFGDTTRHKGIPRNAKPVAKDTWEYMQFQGFITWLNSYATPGMIATTRTKRRLHTYDKGIKDTETGLVSPLKLGVKRFNRPV